MRDRSMPLYAKLLLALCVAYSLGLMFVPALRPEGAPAGWGGVIMLFLCWGIPAAIVLWRFWLQPGREDRLRVRTPVVHQQRDWQWGTTPGSSRADIPADLPPRTRWTSRVLLTALAMAATTVCAATVPNVYLILTFGVLFPAVILSGTPAFRRAPDA